MKTELIIIAFLIMIMLSCLISPASAFAEHARIIFSKGTIQNLTSGKESINFSGSLGFATISAESGDLLRVLYYGGTLVFPYVYIDGQRTEIEQREGLFYMDGRLMAIDLEFEGATDWFCAAEEASLSSLKYINIGKISERIKSKLTVLKIENLVLRLDRSSWLALKERLLVNNPFGLIIIRSAIRDFDEFGMLKNISYLEIDSCPNYKSLDFMSNLISLKILRISSCYDLGVLDGISMLPNLEGLYLENNELLSLENIDSMGTLRVLNVQSSQAIDLTSIAKLTNLISLEIHSSAIRNSSAICSLTKLRSLTLVSLGESTNVSSVALLKELEEVHIVGFATLDDITGINELLNLQVIELNLGNQVESLESITSLTRLKYLLLTGGRISSGTSLNRLVSLEHLSLSEMPMFTDIAGIASLKTLSVLRISYLGIEDISCITGLPGLRELEIDNCTALYDYGPVGTLLNLELLNIDSPETVIDISFLSRCTKLTQLDLRCRYEQAKLDVVALLFQLEILRLQMSGISKLPSLANCRNLRWLTLSDCDSLRDISGLSDMPSMRELDFRDCDLLTNVESVGTLSNLTFLQFIFARKVADIGCFSKLNMLKTLRFSNMNELVDVEPISGLKSLRSLSLLSCQAIKNFSFMSRLSGLEFLSLYDIPELKDLSFVESMPLLRSLYIDNCSEIGDFDPITKPKMLNSLSIRRCAKLYDLLFINECQSIMDISIKNCDNLVNLFPKYDGLMLIFMKIEDCDNILIDVFECHDNIHIILIIDCKRISEKEIQHLNSTFQWSSVLSHEFW